MPRKPILTLTSDGEAAFGLIAAAAMQQAPSFFGVCDSLLRPLFLNAVGRKMIGLTEDADITAYELGEFFAPHSRGMIEGVALPAMLRDGRWAGEACFRDLTEPARETERHVSIFALRSDEGDLIGAAALADDISISRRAERDLRDQQMLLASVLDNLPLGVGVYDHRGSLVRSNQRMRDYTGLARLPSHEPTSSHRWRSYDADGQQISPERYPGARALQGEHVTPGMDFLYAGQDGPERWMRISAVPFRSDARRDANGAPSSSFRMSTT